MAEGSFNPYHIWLSISPSILQPTYYQLLGLDANESDPRRIATAADRALARVRSCRPGDQTARWTTLLDEINAAKSCLTDPTRRAEYDRQLAAGRGSAPRSFARPAPRSKTVPVGPTATPGAVPMAAPVPAQPSAMPYATPVPATARPTSAAPWSQQPAYPASYPMAPVAQTANVRAAGPVYAANRQAPAGIPAGTVPTGVPVAASASPAPVPGKDRTATRMVRKRTRSSSLTPILIGLTACCILGVIVVLVLLVANKPAPTGASGRQPMARNVPLPTPPAPHRTFRQPRKSEWRPSGTAGQLRNPQEFSGQPEDASEAVAPAETEGVERIVPPDEPIAAPESKATFSSPSLPDEKPGLGPLPKFEATPNPFADPATRQPSESEPAPTATDQTPALPETKSDPKPAMPEPKATGPEPTPVAPKTRPAASTEPPGPAVEPTPEEVATLAKALKGARSEVMDQKFDRATTELGKVRSIPMRPEHRAKFDRLDLLAQYARNFRSALAEAIGTLEGGDEIAVGNNTTVGVVQVAGKQITVRVQGANRTYSADTLPAGLAIAIADKWLKKDDPVSSVLKGAYLVTLKDAEPERLAKARELFQEAARRDANFADLGLVIDDTYELEQGE